MSVAPHGSRPIRIGSEGLMVLMVCERLGSEEVREVRNRVRNMLTQERGELIARRQLRDLYRAAFLDIRK